MGQEAQFNESSNNPIKLDYKLAPNYPNPFNPTTTIQYQLRQPEEVRIIIFDLTGKKVRELVNEYQNAGQYTIPWDGKNQVGKLVASGTYVYRIEAGKFIQTRKMLLVK